MAFQQQGTGFTNLNRVVSANQQNRLGSSIQQGIQQDVNKTKENLQKSQQQFNQQAMGQNLQLQNQQKAQQGAGVEDVIKKATTEPNKVTAGDVSAFEQYRKGDYAGPQSLANFSSLQQQGKNVEQLGKQTASAGGQFNLLRQYIGNNRNYTQGQQGLDAILLGQTGQAQLADARNAARNVNKAVMGAGSQAAATAGQIAAGNQALAADVTNKLSAAAGDFNTQLAQQIAQAQKQEEGNQQLTQRVRDYLSGKDTKAFQSDKDAIQALYGAGLIQGDQGAQLDALLGYNQRLKQSYDDLVQANTSVSKLRKLPGADKGWLSQYANAAQDRAWESYNPLNFNEQIAANLAYTGPQNLTAQGVANEQQAAALNALSDLSGKNRQFQTFGTYKRGGNALDVKQLADALSTNLGNLSERQNYNADQFRNAAQDLQTYAPPTGAPNSRYAGISQQDVINANRALATQQQIAQDRAAIQSFLDALNKGQQAQLTNPLKVNTKF